MKTPYSVPAKEKRKVPFVDLRGQYQTIKAEIVPVVNEVLESGHYTLGPHVQAFEEHFAQAHAAKYCAAVSSGTAALHLALWALDVKPGDEVIVPVNTFMATAAAVSLLGATPVFVDCHPGDYTIDCSKIERSITSRTKGIIAVHLYGQPADVAELTRLTKKHGLWLLEDCAQAHLATVNGKPVGTFGIAGCFSFYPSKNLGACGEGGAVVTNSVELDKKVKALRQHGSFRHYYHDFVGANYRMEALQGAILDVKLKYLKQWTTERQQIAKWYHGALSHLPELSLPKQRPDRDHVYHLYVVRSPRRDALMEYLESQGISVAIHYPVPCHLQKAYENLDYREGDFPVAESYAREMISLPMYPELKREDIDYVAEKILEFIRRDNEK